MASTYPIFTAFVMPTGARIMYSTAFPAAASDGTYYAGDIIYNMLPSQVGIASPVGWACVTGGSPGSWAGFGGLGSAGIQALSTSSAIPATQSGNYVITKTGTLAALTLGAPTATTDDGMVIDVSSNTAFAHTITATGLLLEQGTAFCQCGDVCERCRG